MNAASPEQRPKVRGRHRVTLGDRQVITSGLARRRLQDLYHYCMTVGWTSLFATLAALFAAFNLVFACIYRLSPDCIANANPPGYWGYFFFSAETLATVGYGDMHPQTLYGHTVAAMEIFIGIMSLALVTGVMFARFSRPRARFLFAQHAVVRPIEGKLTLMMRAANARQNIIMEASAQLRIIRDRVTPEGYRIRRVEDLTLLRNQHPIFLLGWNIMHVIDADSPLHGETTDSLAQSRGLLVLTLSGTDETTGQMLMARNEYSADQIHWNYGFRDILETGPDGVEYMDYAKFHDVEPLGPQS